jgi:putative ABC transport system permease protein
MRDGVRRSATTAGPVIVLFGLVVGLLGILATQTEASRVERIQQSSAQLVVVSDGDVSDRIRATAGVAVASPETEVVLPVEVRRQGGGWSRVETPAVTAVDPAAYRDLTSMRVLDGRLGEFAAGDAVLGPAAPEDGLGRPSEVRIDGRRLSVVARLATTIAGGADVLVDRHDVPPRVLERAPTTTFVGLAEGASVTDVRARLAPLGTVSTVPVWARGLADQQAKENNGVMAALAGLGGLYAFLSLVNAVAVGTAQRRREFAVARVTGASRTQVIGAAALESCGVGAIGILLGGAVVAVCFSGLRHAIAGTLGVPVLVVPWAPAIGLALAALLAGAATAAVAGWSATRTPPVRHVAAME